MEHVFLDGRVVLHHGDCRENLKSIPDNSVDAGVMDPPYALDSIVKRFGGNNAAPATPKEGSAGAFARSSAGFMGQKWDTGETAFAVSFWQEVYRVLKPGAFLVAFSGTRTYHRMACAIEDAGFEIRDQLAWMYGTGFPKSHNVSKAIDKHLGVSREVIGTEIIANDMRNSALLNVGKGEERPAYERDVTRPGSSEAAEWDGWGTALKPAWEPIVFARKPLIGTVAENVLAHGTGGLNVGDCKVFTWTPDGDIEPRYPANIVHDGSDDVVSAFPNTPGQQGDISGNERSVPLGGAVYGEGLARMPSLARKDAGSAARFFYSAKADGDDRLGSSHPTVKPVDLMRWLVRLVCRKGGTVLDPFAGTGTTGEAAYWEGCNAILMEREDQYQKDIAKRMGLVLSGPVARLHARTVAAPVEALPLFGELKTAPEPPVSRKVYGSFAEDTAAPDERKAKRKARSVSP